MAIFQNQNTSIYYEVYGVGQPLVLLAGLASDSQSWMSVVPELSKHFTLILPDNRGCGRTKCPVDEITIEKMAEDSVALIDYLGLNRVHLMGHSMGAMVAMQIATQHPEKVNRLVFAASTAKLSEKNKSLIRDWVTYWEKGLPMELWFRNLFYWIFSPQFFENSTIVEESLKLAINYLWMQNIEQFEAQVETICQFDMEASLAKINNPTLIISGDQDILFPCEETEKMFQILPNHKSLILSNVAHSIFIEQAVTSVEAVINFLNLSLNSGSKNL